REYESRSKIKSLPYHQKSFGYIAGLSVKVFGDEGIAASWDLLRSLRAQYTLDASLMFLLPDIDYPKTIRRYIQKMRERRRAKLQRSKSIRTSLAKLSEHMDLPTKLAEHAYFDGEYLRRRARKYEGYLSKASQLGSQLFLALAHGAMLVAGAASVVL